MKKPVLFFLIAGGLVLVVIMAVLIFIIPASETPQEIPPTDFIPEQDTFQESKLETKESYFESRYSEESSDTYLVTNEASGSLVAGFPDLPEYPGAKLIDSKAYTEEGGIGHFAKYQSDDSLVKVFNWYQQELSKDGWEVTLAPEVDNQSKYFVLEVVKRAAREEDTIVLSVNGDELSDGSTNIVITHHLGMGEYGPVTKYE